MPSTAIARRLSVGGRIASRMASVVSTSSGGAWGQPDDASSHVPPKYTRSDRTARLTRLPSALHVAHPRARMFNPDRAAGRLYERRRAAEETSETALHFRRRHGARVPREFGPPSRFPLISFNGRCFDGPISCCARRARPAVSKTHVLRYAIRRNGPARLAIFFGGHEVNIDFAARRSASRSREHGIDVTPSGPTTGPGRCARSPFIAGGTSRPPPASTRSSSGLFCRRSKTPVSKLSFSERFRGRPM